MDRVAQALSVALAHSLWQATGIALCVALVHRLLGRGAARARYVAACSALAAQVLAFAVTFAQTWSAPPPEAVLSTAVPDSQPLLHPWIAAAWAVGAAGMALRLLSGLVSVRRMVTRAAELEAEWASRFEVLRLKLRVRRVRWRVSDQLDSPATAGWWKPIILLPSSALTGLPVSTLELLVAHELWHVRRWDYLVNLLQSLAEVILFFHPAMWWVSSRIRSEREACCDDGVVAGGIEPLTYARALAEMEEHRARTSGLVLASTGGKLMWRIDRLVRPQRRGGGAGAWLAAAAVAVLGASAVVAAPTSTAFSTAWLPPHVVQHRAAIEEAARRHGVDADLLAMIVLAESSGDERARSRSGARGLMQLMPKTAERIARANGLAFDESRLDDPSFNLDLGARYVAEQLARFAGNEDPVALAVASYNAGPERVQAALEGRGTLSEETSRYQALVMSMWRERTGAKSTAFETWRARLREKLAVKATAPVEASKLTLGYGRSTDPFDGKPFEHQGVDLAAPSGTPVLAPLDAVVKEVTDDPRNGTVVVLRHGGGVETRYHHLGSVSIQRGQAITRGQSFATVGATGKVTGPHVHFEVRDLGEPVDPTAFLQQRR